MIGLHRDDDKSNNTVENLYWGTYSDNAHDAVRNGTHYPGSLKECKRGHALDGINTTTGHRYCKTCSRVSQRNRRIANPRPKSEMPYGRPRLTDEARAAIKSDQRPLRTIAVDYGVSHTTVRKIQQGLF